MKISGDLLDPSGQWNDILNWMLKLVWLNSWQDFHSQKPDFDDQISSRAKFKVSVKGTIFYIWIKICGCCIQQGQQKALSGGNISAL